MGRGHGYPKGKKGVIVKGRCLMVSSSFNHDKNDYNASTTRFSWRYRCLMTHGETRKASSCCWDDRGLATKKFVGNIHHMVRCNAHTVIVSCMRMIRVLAVGPVCERSGKRTFLVFLTSIYKIKIPTIWILLGKDTLRQKGFEVDKKMRSLW